MIRIWENDIYSQGKHLNLYPYDSVVSFVFRHAPRDRERKEVKILEIGCGAGNNLWFAAREGFSVSGVDGSASAIEFAKRRFRGEKLEADLRVGDFTRLPFGDAGFDMVIERGSLVCVGFSAARRAVQEVYRVLKPGGFFFSNPYSNRDSSAHSGQDMGDGLHHRISEGLLTGVGPLCFYEARDVLGLFAAGWNFKSVQHAENGELFETMRHAEWRVVLEREDRPCGFLRRLDPQDEEIVLRMRNDPYIVARSSSRRAVGVEEHRRWFSALWKNESAPLVFLAEQAEKTIGMVRFEHVTPQDAVITAYLVESYTGRGLGVDFIRASCQIAFLERPELSRITAHVREDNRSGLSGFRKAGFRDSPRVASVPAAHHLLVKFR